MNRRFFYFNVMLCIVLTVYVYSFSEDKTDPAQTIQPGEFGIQYVYCEGVGNIAVRIAVPETPRYAEGAPIVINPESWFVPRTGFYITSDLTEIGAVQIDFLWPGKSDPETGAASDGENDYGGPNALAAFREVVRFACGTKKSVDDEYLQDIVDMDIIYENIGVHAFSHSGVMGTNVLCIYGDHFPSIKYFVGRENPTTDVMYALEPGHFDESGNPLYNPFYDPSGYSPDTIAIDYSSVSWVENAAYPNGNPIFVVENGQDYPVSEAHPQMFGKDYYSRKLIRALDENNVFAEGEWPENLPTPEEADSVLLSRRSVQNYQYLSSKLPELKVMLVFGSKDHVQAALDKPHIHQAYDGFVDKAGLQWVRLNPDEVYACTMLPEGSGFPDNQANTEPADWLQSDTWGYPHSSQYGIRMSIAGAAEMMDRIQYNDWSEDLSQVLHTYTDIKNRNIDPQSGLRYALYQSRPNPFNASTEIRFHLSRPGFVTLEVYNLLGEKIKTLVNEQSPAGDHRVTFNAHTLPSGIYYFRLKAGNAVLTRKCLLMK